MLAPVWCRTSSSRSHSSPAYFAHLVCTRARDHVNAQSRDDDATSIAQSMTSGEGDRERTTRLTSVAGYLKPINPKLEHVRLDVALLTSRRELTNAQSAYFL